MNLRIQSPAELLIIVSYVYAKTSVVREGGNVFVSVCLFVYLFVSYTKKFSSNFC